MFQWFFLAALLIAFCTAGCDRLSGDGSTERKAVLKIRDAEALNEVRDYQRAVEAYEEAMRLDPSQVDAHFKAAVIYDKKLDQFVAAIYHYEVFLKMERDPEKSKLATDFLNNAQFQYVVALPQYKKLANPETSKLQSDNDALHRQISELKSELVRLRSERSAPQAAPPPTPVGAPRVFAPPKPKKPAAPAVKTYRVQKGDGLRTIARKVYGDPAKWTLILEANPQIKSPADLHIGQVLRIP